ncbi:hypothetical protein [Methylobacterium iners]|uniref:Uncharacterized protein n=1 Tax=Methylobacterium iners TaxID=418707 RepID=A0ABQ4RVH2_9HYPH|nr:hypothetical protein [Methylobacterium iners]GJD94786.1 hypothetical protein OCOJLMKI_1990 [Methylobacterium iners]
MTDIFSQLAAQLAVDTVQVQTSPLPKGKSFPEADDVTVMSINYYDNGFTPEQKDKWSESNFTFNWQMFTETQPFTPSKVLAVWSGTTQLLLPDHFIRYLEGKGHAAKMDPAIWRFYMDLDIETQKLPKLKNGPRIGQFRTKYPGDVNHWGDCVRLRWDEFDELNCDIYRDANLEPYASIVVGDPANNLKDPKNLLRGRYDPQGLWKAKHTRKVKP